MHRWESPHNAKVSEILVANAQFYVLNIQYHLKTFQKDEESESAYIVELIPGDYKWRKIL